MTIIKHIGLWGATVALTTVVSGVLPGAPVAASEGAPGCGDREATRRALERMTKVHRLPGAAVRIDDPACGTWTAASGVADRRTGRPMRVDERSRIASVTKTFTATVVLQLAAEGRVSLDAPVERYLPGLIDRNGYDGRKISVRSLLRHTSGLPDHMDSFASTEEFRFRHFEPHELVERALALPPPKKPWHYSTTGYVIAGLIVGKVTGHGVESEVVRRIIKPLGLRDTYWPGDDVRIRGPHPRGYVREEKNGTVRWIDHTEGNMSAGGAGGALISSLRDVSRFFGALMGGRLLPPAQLAEMKRTVEADPDRVWEGARYGLGLIQTPLRCGGDWLGHSGNFEGYSATGGVAPSGRRVAFASNESPPSLEAHNDSLELVQTALCESGAKHS